MQQRRVAPEVRERFAYVKTYLVEAVRQAFAQLTGLALASSSAIEDLGDLDRIDQARTRLSPAQRGTIYRMAQSLGQARAGTGYSPLVGRVQRPLRREHLHRPASGALRRDRAVHPGALPGADRERAALG